MANNEIPPPTESLDYINLLLTGSIQQVTVDKTIWSTKFMFELNSAAGGNMFLGTRRGSTTAPTTLDATSCLAEITPAGNYETLTKTWTDRGGAQFQLEQFYVKGPAGGRLIVSWPIHAVGVL